MSYTQKGPRGSVADAGGVPQRVSNNGSCGRWCLLYCRCIVVWYGLVRCGVVWFGVYESVYERMDDATVVQHIEQLYGYVYTWYILLCRFQ